MKLTTPILRGAHDADSGALFDLVKQFPTPTKIDRETFETTFSALLRDENAYVAVAELDAELVGYVSGYSHRAFYANGSTAWVDEILVRESLRGRGVGRHLMETFKQWAESRGCALVALASHGATEFYRALGYQDTARYFKKYLLEIK